jgi:hypothetical protein
VEAIGHLLGVLRQGLQGPFYAIMLGTDVLLAPDVEGGISDAHLATDLFNAKAIWSSVNLLFPHDILLANIRLPSCRSFRYQ